MEALLGATTMGEPDPLARIKSLYHFTDRRNMESILKHGLCPLATLVAKEITIAAPGGNELSHQLDAELGLDYYVHLAFVYGHPMKQSARNDGRIVEMTTLQIDRRVLEWDGLRFAADVSNKAGVKTYTLQEALDERMIDFDVLDNWMDWRIQEIQERRQRADRCEILVPHCISADLIIRDFSG